MRRAGALIALAALGAAPPVALPRGGAPVFTAVRAPVTLAFPRDHGAHPGYRTEWWYVTGWLDGPGATRRGFQITFFRTATGFGRDSRSRFAPRQILFAHAALSDPAIGHLLHGARAGREIAGAATASRSDADVAIDDWRLRRLADGRFVAHVAGEGFALDLTFTPTQPPLPEGANGYSRKGPDPQAASIYYSIPQLRVSGQVNGRPASGTAWLDREWSSQYLQRDAEGWDWTGLNLADGGALMAFRIRRRGGGTIWAGGTLRAPDGRTTVLGPNDVVFDVRRRWRSPRTGAVYPVAPVLRVRLPSGVRSLALTPLFDDQELDSRPAGPVYWEGAVAAPGARGYLELTGYANRLKL